MKKIRYITLLVLSQKCDHTATIIHHETSTACSHLSHLIVLPAKTSYKRKNIKTLLKNTLINETTLHDEKTIKPKQDNFHRRTLLTQHLYRLNNF